MLFSIPQNRPLKPSEVLRLRSLAFCTCLIRESRGTGGFFASCFIMPKLEISDEIVHREGGRFAFAPKRPVRERAMGYGQESRPLTSPPLARLFLRKQLFTLFLLTPSSVVKPPRQQTIYLSDRVAYKNRGDRSTISLPTYLAHWCFPHATYSPTGRSNTI